MQVLEHLSLPRDLLNFTHEKLHQRWQQAGWCEEHTWLAHSAHERGFFCAVCVLFGTSRLGVEKGERLISKPGGDNYSRVKKMPKVLRAHGISPLHLHAMTAAAEAREGRAAPVDALLNQTAAEQSALTRRVVTSISRVIVWACRQGVALRGHRQEGVADIVGAMSCIPSDVRHTVAKRKADIRARSVERAKREGKVPPSDADTTHMGNFASMTALLAEYDADLRNHLFHGVSVSAVATWTSARIQNELITFAASIVTDVIIAQVQQAKFFTVLADETTDTSVAEIMAVHVRYVWEGVAVEHLLGLVHVSQTDGLTLSQELIQFVGTERRLDLDYMRGQGYDGAGESRGRVRVRGATCALGSPTHPPTR